MQTIALVNPNTSTATTARMVDIAREAAAGRIEIAGLTARFGAALITSAAEIAVAREAVAALAGGIAGRYSGVIVSAFGDPGLDDLRRALAVPVAGIGEAGLLEAAHDGRRFAIVTTTPGLVDAIDAMATRLGLAPVYGGVVLTSGDPVSLTADAARLEAALAAAIDRAIGERGAEAVVIGGGPLAVAARALARRFPVPVVEPIPAAVRWIERALAESA